MWVKWSLFCFQHHHQQVGLGFSEKPALLKDCFQPHKGASTYSSMNNRDINTLNHNRKLVYIIYSSSTVCMITRMWFLYVVWMLL